MWVKCLAQGNNSNIKVATPAFEPGAFQLPGHRPNHYAILPHTDRQTDRQIYTHITLPPSNIDNKQLYKQFILHDMIRCQYLTMLVPILIPIFLSWLSELLCWIWTCHDQICEKDLIDFQVIITHHPITKNAPSNNSRLHILLPYSSHQSPGIYMVSKKLQDAFLHNENNP